MYQKRNKEWDIVALFLGDYTKQFYLREISKRAQIPLKTTQNLIANLEEDNVIKSTLSGKHKYFRLNRDNIKTKLCLLQSEIQRTSLFIERYLLFMTFLKEIKTNTPLIAFGSFAKFKADTDSDLDLLIVSRQKQSVPFHLLPYKIHEITMSETSFTKAVEKQEALAGEIADNHIILNNHSFYVNVMWDYYGR